MGDFRAQIAAIRTGEAALRRAAEEVRSGRRQRQHRRRVRADRSGWRARRLARFPTARTKPSRSWTTTASATTPIPIKVKVIVAGDHMTIDLSDVSPQVQGYFNSGATAGRSAAQVAFKCVTTPTQYPINDGAFRNLYDRAAAGTRGQRDQTGRDALVDDDPDDRRRHDHPRARTRDSRPRRGRPSCRSLHRHDVRHQPAHRPLLRGFDEPARRRLGRDGRAATG